MKINLRKANAIQQEIKSALRELPVISSVQITEFEDPDTAIESARAKSAETRDTWTRLTATLFEIRRKTARANVESRISDVLADLAEVDEQISMLRGLADAAALRMDPTVLEGRIAKIRETPQEGGIRRFGAAPQEGIESGIFSKEEVDGHAAELAALKRRKRDLKDRLLGLNVSTEIEISENGVAALKSAGII